MNEFNPERFRIYKMTSYEKEHWELLVEEVKHECRKFNVPAEYAHFIENELINENRYFSSVKGYSKDYGYYVISIGDRGKLFTTILTKNKEDAKIRIIKKILWNIGTELEVDNRNLLLGEWHYDYDEYVDGKWQFKENKGKWNYDAIYDSRVFYFTYLIQKLSIVSPDILKDDVTTNYISLLSKKSLNFDRFFLEFYLSENTKDKLIEKESMTLSTHDIYIKGMIALENLFGVAEWEHWKSWTDDKIERSDPKVSAASFLSGFGGMGSLNDVYISSQNRNKISEVGEPWFNTLFFNLLSVNSMLAKNLLDDIEITEDQLRMIDGRIMNSIVGYSCRKCNCRYITTFHLDSFIASNTLGNLLISSLIYDEFDSLLKRCSQADFSWAEDKRLRFIKEMKSQRIRYAESSSSCPKCGRDEHSVFYWDNFSNIQDLKYSSRFDNNTNRTSWFSFFNKKR